MNYTVKMIILVILALFVYGFVRAGFKNSTTVGIFFAIPLVIILYLMYVHEKKHKEEKEITEENEKDDVITQSEENKMFCKFCGKPYEQKDGITFCQFCGKELN